MAGAHPVTQRWISELELDANPGLVRSMSVQPPRGHGRVRLIDSVDLQPCGGTHVANTAEIGTVVVTKIEKKSARTRRGEPGCKPAPACWLASGDWRWACKPGDRARLCRVGRRSKPTSLGAGSHRASDVNAAQRPGHEESPDSPNA